MMFNVMYVQNGWELIDEIRYCSACEESYYVAICEKCEEPAGCPTCFYISAPYEECDCELVLITVTLNILETLTNPKGK